MYADRWRKLECSFLNVVKLALQIDCLIRTGVLDCLGLFIHCWLLIFICHEYKIALTSMIVVSHLTVMYDHNMMKKEKIEL